MCRSGLITRYEYLFINDTVAATYVEQYTGPSSSALAMSDKLHLTPGAPKGENEYINMFVPRGCGAESQICPTEYALTTAELEGVKRVYNQCKIGASKADLLRLLLIYQYGGIYFDADTACNRPIREWVHPEASFVTSKGERGDLMQWGIISVPGHPIIAQVLRLALRSATIRGPERLEENVEFLAGPPIFWEGARGVLCNPELGGVAHRMQAFKTNMFAGRTAFKAPGVDQERHQQGHKHWHDQMGDDKKAKQAEADAKAAKAEAAPAA